MRYFLLSLSTVTLLLIQGCGQRELTQTEKSRLSQTVASLTSTVSAVQQASSRLGTTGQNSSALPGALAHLPASTSVFLGPFAVNNDPTVDQRVLEDKMQKALAGEACSIPNAFPTSLPGFSTVNPSAEQVGPIQFRIEGSKCPMQVQFSLTPTGDTQSNGKLDFNLKYEVVEPEIAELSRFSRAELSASLSFESNVAEISKKQGNANGFGSDTPYVIVRGDSRGTFQSLDEGEIKASVRMFVSSKEMKNELSLKLEFKDFVAELTSERDSSTGDEILLLNGKKVSQQELSELFPQLMSKQE
jgi:hypothetical protein